MPEAEEISTLSPELQRLAREELNEDPKRREKDIQAVREWLVKQPHLNARTGTGQGQGSSESTIM